MYSDLLGHQRKQWSLHSQSVSQSISQSHIFFEFPCAFDQWFRMTISWPYDVIQNGRRDLVNSRYISSVKSRITTRSRWCFTDMISCYFHWDMNHGIFDFGTLMRSLTSSTAISYAINEKPASHEFCNDLVPTAKEQENRHNSYQHNVIHRNHCDLYDLTRCGLVMPYGDI